MPDPTNKVKRAKKTNTTTTVKVKPVKKANWQKQIDELGGSASIWNDPSAVGVSMDDISAYYKASEAKKKPKKKRGGSISKDSWSNRSNQRD
tara:strand:+ start:1725 stop:2000 length:276 start_codon:yes stop_codon:yes gene_type:complete